MAGSSAVVMCFVMRAVSRVVLVHGIMSVADVFVVMS